MTIPASAIHLSYLWPCTAAAAAVKLWGFYGAAISERALIKRWNEECVDHPVLRDLGPRPKEGFYQSAEHVQLAKVLVQV